MHVNRLLGFFFFFSSRRRHTRLVSDWSSDVCSSDLLYTAAGLDAPVYLDADFLLGPEAAHLNISGVSGLATKTSAVEFLLASIFEHFQIGRASCRERV